MIHTVFFFSVMPSYLSDILSVITVDVWTHFRDAPIFIFILFYFFGDAISVVNIQLRLTLAL